MTQEPASRRVASCCVATSYCELAKLQRGASQNDATQGNARIESSSISASLVLRPTNQISAKKHVRVLRALYGVRKRYVPIFAFEGGLRLFPYL